MHIFFYINTGTWAIHQDNKNVYYRDIKNLIKILNKIDRENKIKYKIEGGDKTK